ncbi:hypothetical protein PLEOSDRAFT_1101000 [Pleurotus ostreatus PC15]|uniref:Uncharacterized protein n=1 Tax=Pleurotus ostreatus (strain PC15) TaxID=1137138 RepID=A0A067P271_PLEO1|nr:hypothetical protein PLEOSDRAFT_1101000 [Pleurotus ostreatus PC15]
MLRVVADNLEAAPSDPSSFFLNKYLLWRFRMLPLIYPPPTPHPMALAPFNDKVGIYLANPNASDVRHRPDRGSVWLAITSKDDDAWVTVRQEHNASFTVPFATIKHVTKIDAEIDIDMYDVGYYSDSLELIEGVVTVLAPKGQSKSWPVIKGRLVAAGDHTLRVYTEGPNAPQKELRSPELQRLRETIDDALDTLQDADSSPRERRQAKIIVESTFATFVAVVSDFFAAR